MARKASSGTNKSAAIRDYKAANPTAPPKEIAEALSKSGATVSPQFVSTVLSNAKKNGGKIGKRGRKPMAVPMDNIQQLIQVKKFVDQIGGLEKAKAAVDVLAQILG
ncbi:hypothetical protein [Anatilimnocola floriformis]|uniref:hypothetical protein n=1 Tax=Anatilimnocola floriformis TaxID=2948575 RepID=UPI0020C52ED5|nr:hypothetical protein [Anatilimnocola floriformis]